MKFHKYYNENLFGKSSSEETLEWETSMLIDGQRWQICFKSFEEKQEGNMTKERKEEWGYNKSFT